VIAQGEVWWADLSEPAGARSKLQAILFGIGVLLGR
jgi:hypothetical protein